MHLRLYILLLFGGGWLACYAGVSYAAGAAVFQQLPQQDTAKTDSIKPYVPSTRPTYTPPYRFGDPFSFRRSTSSLNLPDPSNLDLQIDYDSGFQYTIYERIGNLNFRPVTTMPFSAYDQYHDEQATQGYWREKSIGLDGESAVSGRRLIPKLYLSPVFDRIFGGSYVDITPSGFINMDFGGTWQNVDNPAIPQRQQRNGGFNFNQQISLNLVGKVGDKLEITANYDNNNTFDFQNNMRIEYTGYDYEIIKKIIIGNVSMPVANSLMTGSQTLFGVKTEMQFGKLWFTGVASRQQGSLSTSTLGGGGNIDDPIYNPGQQTENELKASTYDENRHFFLSHFFRDNFESWVRDPRNITSGLLISNIEVYVTNTTNTTTTTRNIVGFMDLGESVRSFNPDYQTANQPVSNTANSLYQELLQSGFRQSNEIYNQLQTLGLDPANEYVVTTTARQLQEGTEFVVNKQLGYITLLTNLSDNQSLSVAYQYTYNGQVFTVGEISSERRLPDDQSIFLKLLRPNSISPELPTWDLMMKNVYNLRGSNINPENFRLRIKYKDDNSGIDNPSLHEGGDGIENVPLVQLLKLDQYNLQLDPQPDGLFDFIPGVTINPERGYLIFPVLEPFGSTLESYFDPTSQANLIEKYVFNRLYDDTRQLAATDTERDKFRIAFSGAGSGQGGAGSDRNNVIKLEGFQVTPGSVVVYMGNVKLEEGRHYTVDYNFGTVTIIDESVLNSGAPISATSESADLFNFQTTWFYGARLDYRFNEKFNVGATVLHLNERRGGISRFSLGNEPMRNTKYGFDINITEESRFLTKMVDALPLVSTKEQSEVTFNAEYAKFIPGTSNDVDGTPTSYIDDFEQAVTPLRLAGPLGWKLGATPETNNNRFFNQGGLPGREFNYRRAKLAWYEVDQSVFYRTGGNRPDHLTEDDLSNHYVRPVIPQEIFKQRDAGQINQPETLFELAFFPSERGQQNYNPNLTADGRLQNPLQNFGAITRGFENETNFLQSNFQYIEFWLLDPFIQGPRGRVLDGVENTNNTTGGELVFNLGSVSEDIVPDGTFFFENGLPGNGDPADAQVNPDWGLVPSGQFLTPFFTNNANERRNQDVGYDGLRDDEEADFFSDFVNAVPAAARDAVQQDVSGDNFRYFLGSELDAREANIVERYKNFNGTDGNSPVNEGTGFTPSSYINPDIEDINGDNTVSFLEEYFEYKIPLEPGQLENNPYVVDQVTDDSGEATWYQFRIPISRFTGKYGDPNFQTIRFMRLYMAGWQQPVVLRMAKFQMTRGAWRKFEFSLREPGLSELPEPQLNDFDISVVSIEENSTGSATQPPYVVPPGLERDVNNQQTVNTRYNEQSLQLCVENLENGDARGAFKTQFIDLINYDRLEMFFHAHSNSPGILNDEDVSAFIRLGQDNSQNYYEIEVPLVVTPQGLQPGGGIDRLIWPRENEISLAIDQLVLAKIQRNRQNVNLGTPFSYIVPNTNYRITVVGNPELNAIETMMIGVRNPDKGTIDDGLAKSVCIWANELRGTGYKNESGWAANATLQAKLADFARVNFNTRYSSIGYGALNTTIAQRNRFESLEYQANANVNLEKFMYPEKTGLVVPVFVNYKRQQITPQYDPLNQDILLEESLKLFDTDEERDEYENLMQSQSVARGINFTNVRKDKVKEDAKSRVYDIENFSFTYAYSDETSSNHFTQNRFRKNVVGGMNYDYSPVDATWEPFAKSEALSSPYLALIKDVNFNPLPSNLSFSANLNRMFTSTQFFNDDLTTDGIDPNYERLFTFTRLYNLRWNIFKSLAFDYNANVRAVIDEPDSIIAGDINTRAERQYVWDQILNLGRMKQFDQTFTFTYKTPLGKLPFTDWMGADLRYVGGYTWVAGPLNQTDTQGNTFGNNIQNRRDRSVNGNIDMVKLYDKVTFLNAANKSQPGERTFGQSTLLSLMALRSINVTYNVRETTSLAGFTPQAFLFGLDSGFNAPGLPFIFGDQSADIRFRAANRGWLTPSPFLTAPFTQSKGTDLNIRGTFQPFTDLSIQVDFTKSNTNGYQEIFRYDTLEQRHVSLTPSRSGTYSVSFLSIATAFERPGRDNSSAAFTQFEENLNIMVDRLNSSNANGDYDPLSQDVLIPAFLAAYSGKDARSYRLNPFPRIPLPNWRLDYNGLMRIPAIADMFAALTLSHGYRSIYTVGNFTNNLRYSDNLTLDFNVLNYPKATEVDTLTGNLVPAYVINQVMISESFVPLLGINLRTKSNISTRLEFKTERNLALNMSNAQVTETTNRDVTLDFGYSKVGFKIPWRFQGRTTTLPNNITFRTSLTVRDSQTIQRKINGESLITNGSISYQLRPNVTYNINKQLDFTMYFERTVTTPKVLNSFRRALTAFGFQLRFNLSQ